MQPIVQPIYASVISFIEDADEVEGRDREVNENLLGSRKHVEPVFIRRPGIDR